MARALLYQKMHALGVEIINVGYFVVVGGGGRVGPVLSCPVM